MKKTMIRILALALCAAVCLPLTGCRYSDVLEQIIYDLYRGSDIDPEQDFKPNENDEENEDTSDSLKELLASEESERFDEQTEEMTANDETNSDSGALVEYAEDGTLEQPAAAPEEILPDSSSDDPGTVPTAPVEEEIPEETLSEEGVTENPENESDGGDGASGTGDEGTEYEPDADTETYKQVVDAYGKEVSIPEQVERVTAVGNVAIMVMMLGGGDALCATNSGLADDSLLTQIYPQAETATKLWSGSGTQALSEENFAQLLAAQPDVVIESSGSTTVTNAQAEALAGQGIAYLVLPQPTNLGNVQTIMTTLGAVLGDQSESGGVNAPAIAQQYVEWTGSLYSTVSAATANAAPEAPAEGSEEEGEEASSSSGAIYTLYVDGWDASASFQLSAGSGTAVESTGFAYISNGGTSSCKSISAFLSYANVDNAAAHYGVAAKTQYYTPLLSQYISIQIAENLAAGCYPSGQTLLKYNGVSLGETGFQTIIAADQATKAAIESDRDYATSGGQWSVYPVVNNGGGTFNTIGFTDQNGNLIPSQIADAYQVIVNPCGATSWTAGSAEGILESAWAAWRFSGALSEDQVRGYISDFYTQFYGYTLSAQQISSILEGK